MEDVTEAFKKFKDCILFTSEGSFFIAWGRDKKTGLPNPTIYGGYSGAPQPSLRLDPRDVKCIEYTVPKLFQKGEMRFIDMNGSVLGSFQFKDKGNLKTIERMNTYLELYRRYNL